MTDVILMGLSIAAFSAALGFIAGAGLQRSVVIDDCHIAQQFRIADKVFDCKERSK